MVKKQLIIDLKEVVKKYQSSLDKHSIDFSQKTVCKFPIHILVKEDETEISDVLNDITNSGLPIRDLKIVQSTLEDIFVDLVKEKS